MADTGAMALLPLACVLFAAVPQNPAPVVPAPPPELVFVAAEDPVPLSAFGLGEGGVRLPEADAKLLTSEGEARTPGGVLVAVLDAGVKVTFASGRELLFAPDGFLHLRDEAMAGPFVAGIELHFGDGAVLGVHRSTSRREPITEVVVSARDRVRRIWRRGKAVDEYVRAASAPGQRLLCCGQGDELFSALGLMPLVVLERVLCPRQREAAVPMMRVAVLSAPLIQSLQALPREVLRPVGQQQEALRLALRVAQMGTRVFDAASPPPRVDRKQPRYALAGGYEVQVTLDGTAAPKLQLFTGRGRNPFVEWSLGFASEARLLGATADDSPETAARGRVRLGEALPAFAARRELREVEAAFAALRRLGH
jgi:hypothetical protein